MGYTTGKKGERAMSELTELQKEWLERVERELEGLEAVSTGACPTCPQCMDEDGYEDPDEHEEAVSCGDVYDEPGFSWRPCGICGCHLGGDRHRWHWLDEDGDIVHEDDACSDCVYFLANGDVPEDEYLDWLK